MNKQESILAYWHDIEIFTLPDVPDDAHAIALYQQLPWKKTFEKSDQFQWRHTIYLGKREKQEVVNLIEKKVGLWEQEPEWIERPSGATCMAVIVVDEHGKASHDGGYIQASYMHGLKCLAGRLPVDRVGAMLADSQRQFRERYPINQFGVTLEAASSPVLEWGHLIQEIQVLNDLGVYGHHCLNTIHVKSTKVWRETKPDPTFLNSFYLDDLRDILASKNWGKGLQAYLSNGVEDRYKRDILKDADAFFELLDPMLVPPGRWPSNPEHGLYTAQSAAVNTSLRHLSEHTGIIGVNGPPGTGKTTLLKDIIAEVVTERARLLLSQSVTSLFDKGRKIEKRDSYGYYFAPKAAVFKQTGIVVASNNNAAVENISKELPAESAIDRTHFSEASYFSEACENLIEGPSWGLLAAALGNSKNKLAFKNRVWFSKSDEFSGFSSMLYSIYADEAGEDQTSAYENRFETCKKELTDLLAVYDAFRNEAYAFYKQVPRHIQDIKRKAGLLEIMEGIDGEVKTLEVQKKRSLETSQRLREQITSVNRRLALKLSDKPVFFIFHKLFKTESYRNWASGLAEIQTELSKLNTQLSGNEYQLGLVFKNIDKQQNLLRSSRSELDDLLIRESGFDEKREHLKGRYGIEASNLPDDKLYELFETDMETFHRGNPWSSVSLNVLRSNIFLTSLKLHEYAICANAKAVRNNLNLFMEVLDGRVQVPGSLAAGLWQTFFFCIPVVSTSLASVNKLFEKLPKESIGWLLLDEAGQATPQSAVGAIYRSARTVIIGDPLQIEPVVTIPEKLSQILNKPYQTEPVWSPLRSSAQTLADRNTGLGTWLDKGEIEKIWSGLPLRTHRRCNSPMFDLANTIAYNGQMVKAGQDVPYNSPLGDSAWFDVAGITVVDKQVVAEEIELLVEKMMSLQGITTSIFVISPFKAVADACSKALRRVNPSVKCGTIHTFQGKEADIVFLVLGSAPDKPASRQWASAKPNMLNVALTRAKRKIYVIGNKKMWASYPYFESMGKVL